ncbi:hypothetical protein ACFQ3R_10370 [Mesonia ostreae]|uniref:Uncharacterized protein n=1 Tax=Mesonia ostreae TaxID=861110 RepID=A0ABU2KGK3_9FLAO|nr:hypothetical protein [Mesonia ostreae]MDT0293783.1 hypothetical protein [Mesonia ostreae]
MYTQALKIAAIIAILFFSGFASAQSYVFLDEDGKEVSAEAFGEKCDSNLLFNCTVIKQTKKLVVAQIRFKQKFGKISTQEMDQVRKLLRKDSGRELEKEKTLLISYYDSLADFKASKKMHDSLEKKFIDQYKNNADQYKKDYKSEKVEYFIDFSREIFDDKIKDFVKDKNRCKKKFEKRFNVNVLFMHADNVVKEKQYSNFDWIQDRGVINTVFIKNDLQNPFISKKVRFLVIKPDGEYFISNNHFNENTKILKKLLKNKDWSDYKEDYKKSLYGNIMGEGLFKRKPKRSHERHCF